MLVRAVALVELVVHRYLKRAADDAGEILTRGIREVASCPGQSGERRLLVEHIVADESSLQRGREFHRDGRIDQPPMTDGHVVLISSDQLVGQIHRTDEYSLPIPGESSIHV